MAKTLKAAKTFIAGADPSMVALVSVFTFGIAAMLYCICKGMSVEEEE
ncbi:MAG: hypothetical protein ISN26_02700 [Betaproteobacteria bacterium AqS2]|uniref:Uncharacterized protein n=1 Tax=Candidatus Amphirhobacter heronislandensis TaxID=1732024 RepID=A0A930UFZ8_9GAMM|nr:hypothetical protein [Betaproteobacteria bacterium AqS2]